MFRLHVTHLLCTSLWFFIICTCQVSKTQVVEGPLCPAQVARIVNRLGGCDSIKCNTGLTQEKCPRNSILEEGVAFCGCCPGCVTSRLKYKDSCSPADAASYPQYNSNCTDLICPIEHYCPKGLTCNGSPTNGTCDVPLSFRLISLIGQDCPNRCFIKRSIIEYENEAYAPQKRAIPTCTPDGYFAPKQCKGTRNDGHCYCVDKCGTRLFGRQLFEHAENMTCGCTNLVHNLREQGPNQRIATFHCKENGDFEPLQCDTDSGLCYCVDEITGKTTGDILPENKFKLLPCYDATDENFSNDGRYLRVCESEWAAGQKITQDGLRHGVRFHHTPMDCDYDGGFASKHRDTELGQERCVHRSGRPQNYFRAYNPTAPNMDCNCARDQVYFPRNGIPFLSSCSTGGHNAWDPAPGSYRLFETNNQDAYCLDSDGFPFGRITPSFLACCLDSTCPNSIICDRPLGSNVTYYIPCVSYYMGRY